MNVVENLITCKLCHGIMKDPRILACQHTFCCVCLKKHADKSTDNRWKCPKCFNKFKMRVEDLKKNHFINILINLKKCGMCEKKEADEFCEECDQSFCLPCAKAHSKITVCQQHSFVRLYDGEQKEESKLDVFCADCDEFLELTLINSHYKHELITKELGIEKRFAKWKEEVQNITDCRVEYKKGLIIDEENWSVKKEELLKMKSQLEENYREFIEFLHDKKNMECEKIHSEIDKIEEKIRKYKEQIQKEISNLKEDKKVITNKVDQIKRGLEEVLNDKSSYKLPPLLPPLNLPHYLAFKPSPTDSLCNLLPSIKLKDLKQLLNQEGQYELKREKSFKGETEWGKYWLRQDAKYLYACYMKKHKILVLSLDTLQLIQTLQCPEGFEPDEVVCVNNKFCVTDQIKNKILLLDKSRAVLNEVLLPANGWSLKNNGSDEVIITCRDFQTVVSYDVDTRKLETVPTPSVQEILQCCSMGRDAYCMCVETNGCGKIIKCVQGNIIQSCDVGAGYNDIFIKDGNLVYVLEDVKKMVHILDGDLQLISSLPIDSTERFQGISVDSEWKIRLSILDSSKNFFNIRTYQLKW